MNISILKKKKKSNNIVKILFLLILILFTYVNYESKYNYSKVSMIITLLSSVILLYKSRKDIGNFLAFAFIFYAMYKISSQYLFNVKTTFYSFFYIDYNYNLVISILCYFTTFMAIFYKQKAKHNDYFVKTKDNALFFYILYFVSVFILIFGIKRMHAESYVVSITAIYEYFIIVFIFAYYYSGKSKIKKYFLLLLGVIYVLQDFYYGGRICSIQFLILVSLLYFSKKLNSKNITVLSLPAIFLLELVGIYRNSFSLQGINFSMVSIFNSSSNYKFNTFSEVLYSSSALTYAKLNTFTLIDRLNSFILFITNIFIGGKNMFGDIISYISTNISIVGGGGYIPVYFYFWFGWLGVALISLFICFIFNEGLKFKWIRKDYYVLFNIVFISMLPRWFSYTPLILFRYVILNFTIAYCLLYFSNSLMKRNNTA